MVLGAAVNADRWIIALGIAAALCLVVAVIAQLTLWSLR